jgi:hypothetical protein
VITTDPFSGAAPKRVKVRITNSLLEDVQFDFGTSDTIAPGSSFVFGFDTLTFRDYRITTFCDTPYPFRTVLFENTILWRFGSDDIINGFNCAFVGALLWPQMRPIGGQVIVADPQFVSPTMHDFQLKSTSPAIDAAVTSQSAVGADLVGTPRPQGAKPDLGAYERKP